VRILKDLRTGNFGQNPAKQSVCSEVRILKDLAATASTKTKNASKMLALPVSNRAFL
jgi:hypothetical protein